MTVRPRRIARVAVTLLGLLALPGVRADDAPVSASTANPAAATEFPGVEVIGITPLPGLGQPLSRVPANVQSSSSVQIERQKPLDLTQYMTENLNGVFINQTQDNPFQPDVNYRGFSATPLLGGSEGLSVYLDGVRINEAFGDVVNWDLIPESAISSITLMPGSNPLFGLNTLGGALSVQTKSGHAYPGTRLQAYGGSFGRHAEEFETGGEVGAFDYFLTGNVFDEDGWRQHSPSHVRQLFAKVGWQDARTDVDLSYAWADTNITGNGLTPYDMMASLGRDAIFTFSDITKNHLNFINLNATHFLSETLLLSANAHFRQIVTKTFNGDLGDNYQDDYEASIAPGGNCAADPAPATCAASEFAFEAGVNHASFITQRAYGFTLQATDSTRLLGRESQLIVGAGYDKGRNDFTQFSQDATVTAARWTQGDDAPAEDASVSGTQRTSSAFVTETFSPTKALALTASARYNDTRAEIDDRQADASGVPGAGGVDGFRRVNPALGATYTFNPQVSVYAGYNEGSRAPTPIELGCADPAAPCKLPNDFASDPPLRQVVAKTLELGVRGRWAGERLHWYVTLYHTRVDNEIQFIANALSGAGFYDNVGRTRRQGIEVGLNGQIRDLRWRLAYSYIDATYRDSFAELSPHNSSADAAGVITVPAGASLPEVPRQLFKGVFEYAVVPRWTVGMNLLASAGAFVRGNENNQHTPGTNAAGITFEHSGHLGSYFVMNLHSQVDLIRHVALFGRLDNVFNAHYATAGQLSSNAFDASGHFNPAADHWPNVTAIAPAGPRAVWAGLELSLD